MALKDINVTEFIKDVDGIDRPKLTEQQLAIKYGVTPRSIRFWKQELRDNGKLKYIHPAFKKNAESSVNKCSENINKDEDNFRYGQSKITKSELIKLFSIYGTKTAVAKALDIATNQITNACKSFNIVTETEKLLEIRNALQYGNDEYNKIAMPNNLQQKEEHLGVILSDWHAGKLTIRGGKETYNLSIFDDRADRIVNGIIRLLSRNIKRGANISIVDLFLLGDLCDGSGEVYPGQVFNLESGFPRQVISVLNALRKLAGSLSEMGYEVRFHCVPGNHGSAGSNPENNFDTLVYMLIEDWIQVSKIKNVYVEYSTTDYLDVNINGYKIHMRHKAIKQNKTASGRAKFLGWSKIHNNCDILLSAHFHTPYFSPENGIISIMNGALPGVDDFSDMLGLASEPCQVCFGLPKKRPVSFFYMIDIK